MNRVRGCTTCLVLLGALLLGALAPAAQPVTASSFDEATKRYQNRTREAELQYLLDLKAAFKTAMANGDLDGAKKIDAVRGQIEKDLKDRSPRELPAVPEAGAAKPSPAASAAPAVTEEFVTRHVVGDWVLENAKGALMSPMKVTAGADGQVELTRVTGAQYTVCGTYTVTPGKLVKVKVPGDQYWDLTWQFDDGKWTLRGSNYVGWTLKRPPP